MGDTSLDPEFDALHEWVDVDCEVDYFPIKKPLRPARPAPARRPWWLFCPISRSAQSVFAESLGRTLAVGLDLDHALMLAAEVNPSRRFRAVLEQMRRFIRQGYAPESALEKTWARVDPALMAVFHLGPGDGSPALADELRALARSLHPRAARSFARRIGRSPRAAQFASALARRLRQERLTVRAVIDAGAVASAGSRRFARKMEAVANRIRDGASLVEALSRHRRHFDPIFLATLQQARSRDEMRRALELLGDVD